MGLIAVAVLIDLPEEHPYYTATLAALGHAASARSLNVQMDVIRTDQLGGNTNLHHSALVIGPGSPYLEPEAVIHAIRTAREQGVPLVGTWGGFQHVLVEHARSLAGIQDAVHAEYGRAGTPLITVLACSLMEQQIAVELTPGSRLQALYGTRRSVEHTTCNYGLDPQQQHVAEQHGMRIAATDETGEVRAIERVDHPFFVGTLFQPQLRSAPSSPHPVFTGFLEAAAKVCWCNWRVRARPARPAGPPRPRTNLVVASWADQPLRDQ